MAAILPSSVALIVAAGSGNRFGGDKVILPLAGLPVVAWSLRAFQETPSIGLIALVVPAGKEAVFGRIAAEAGITKLGPVVAGGATRRDSVMRGLSALPAATGLVAIHDAARPLVTPALIERCLAVAGEAGASAAACPVTETLHQADSTGNAVRTIDRTALWAMQTPQVFRAAPLSALLSGAEPGTDEVSAALAAGWRISFVENLEPNPKITWPADLRTASALLGGRNMKNAG